MDSLLTRQGTINKSREAALFKIYGALKWRRDQLEGVSLVCNYECDSRLLGALLKSMKMNGLSMDATPPYPGLAVEQVVQRISEFNEPKSNTHPTSFLSQGCNIPGLHIQREMDDAMSSLQGLALE